MKIMDEYLKKVNEINEETEDEAKEYNSQFFDTLLPKTHTPSSKEEKQQFMKKLIVVSESAVEKSKDAISAMMNDNDRVDIDALIDLEDECKRIYLKAYGKLFNFELSGLIDVNVKINILRSIVTICATNLFTALLITKKIDDLMTAEEIIDMNHKNIFISGEKTYKYDYDSSSLLNIQLN